MLVTTVRYSTSRHAH